MTTNCQQGIIELGEINKAAQSMQEEVNMAWASKSDPEEDEWQDEVNDRQGWLYNPQQWTEDDNLQRTSNAEVPLDDEQHSSSQQQDSSVKDDRNNYTIRS